MDTGASKQALVSAATGRSNVAKLVSGAANQVKEQDQSVAPSHQPQPQAINTVFINYRPNVQSHSYHRFGYQPNPDLVSKRDRLKTCDRVLEREDVVHREFLESIRCWKSLILTLGHTSGGRWPEIKVRERIARWEREAEDTGAETWKVTRWALLGWMQKEDLNATMKKLVKALSDLKEWAAIAEMKE